MASNLTSMNEEISFRNLDEAARLLASETDRNRLVNIALMSLTFFTHSKRIELWLFVREDNFVKNIGLLSGGKITIPDTYIPTGDTPFGTILESKEAGIYRSTSGAKGLYLPMIGSKSRIQGVLVIDISENEHFTESAQQTINILTALISASLERIQYYHMAIYDGLTGLYVRHQFDIRIHEETARVKRYGGNLGLMFADIDHFKRFNDTYGHPVGDKILRKIGEIFREASRETDVLARYGGDEFVILLPQTNSYNTINMAERINNMIKNHTFKIQGHNIKSTITMGISTVPQNGIDTPQDLFESADRVLIDAKRSCKNRIFVANNINDSSP